jgi:membrane-associated phospholipid phosphatase
MIESLLQLDTQLLIRARSLVWPEYANIVQILWESIVIYGALLLLGIWFTWVYKKDNAWKIWALQIFFTIILTFSVYTAINFGFPAWRANPQEVVGWIAPLIPHPLDNSFPSGHALFTAALLVGIFRFCPKKLAILWATIFWIFTVSARVIGWVHYPGDIIGGLIFWAIGAYIVSFFVDTLFFRKYIFGPIVTIAKLLRL